MRGIFSPKTQTLAAASNFSDLLFRCAVVLTITGKETHMYRLVFFSFSFNGGSWFCFRSAFRKAPSSAYPLVGSFVWLALGAALPLRSLEDVVSWLC